VITLNVNGIRSAAAKGLFPWLAQQQADVICLQEVRGARSSSRGTTLRCPVTTPRSIRGPARLRRRRAVFARRARACGAWLRVREFDGEGRYLEAQFPALSIVSLYLPFGLLGSGAPEIQGSVSAGLLPHLRALKRRRRHISVRGLNIAHREIDLKNWRSNQKNSGFLPHERAWLDELFDEVGYIDAFRSVNAQPEQYTWWSIPRQPGRRMSAGASTTRLPARARRCRPRRADFQGAALLRSRPADHGLRARDLMAGSKPRFRDIVASRKMLVIMALGAASGFPTRSPECAAGLAQDAAAATRASACSATSRFPTC